ncbi:MAG: TonB-dependent receptor [Pseudomonadota bacterium]
MGRRFYLALASATSVVALIGSPGNAVAQVDADGPARAVDEIVVSGEKVQRTLQETVSSVAVYNEETIDDQNFVDLFDLINQTANVSGLANDGGFTIRGLRNFGVGAGNISDTATVYLDGVFLPSRVFSTSPLNLWDIQSVEIFRGPQSTIQGRNALIGAVVARTVDPGSEWSGKAQLRYGEFDSFRGSGAVTVPVLEDQVSLRLAGDYTETNGFVDNVTLMENDAAGAETVTGRAKLYITPAALPDLDIRFNVTYSDVTRGTAGIEEALFPGRLVTFQNVRDEVRTETFLASTEINYDLSDRLTVTSVSAYIDTSVRTEFDVDAGPTGAPVSPLSTGDDEIFSQELRLSYQGDRFNVLLGGYYFNSKGDTRFEGTDVLESALQAPEAPALASLLFQTLTPTPPQIAQADALRTTFITAFPFFEINTVNIQNNDIENYALFGEASYDLTDKFTLTFGARVDFENIDQGPTVGQSVPPAPITGNPQVDALAAITAEAFTNQTSIDAENDFSAFLPKAVATYNWTDDFATSFSYQRAYRAGGLSFNGLRLATATAIGAAASQAELEAQGIVSSFDPEFTDNYELSLRSRWFGGRLTVNANAFAIDYSDQQVNVVLSPNPDDSLTTNVANSKLRGFEVEVFANPSDGLDLFANVGFTDTEFGAPSDLVGILEDATFLTDLTGLQFLQAPRWTAGVGGRYVHATGLFTNLRIRYTGDAFSTIQNDPSGVNGRSTIADLIVGYEGDSFTVEFFAENLFDDRFLTLDPLAEPDGSIAQGAFAVPGAPQLFGGRITAEF